jgi:hypothetical protein
MFTTANHQPGGAWALSGNGLEYVVSQERISRARSEGQDRHDHARQQGFTHLANFTGSKSEALNNDFLGCLTEPLVAEATGLPWCGVLKDKWKKLPDVGDDIEVRATEHIKTGSLILRPTDDPGRRYILSLVELPIVWLRGWLYGFECQHPQWWGTKGTSRDPCWWAPQPALRPMETLTELYVKQVCGL